MIVLLLAGETRTAVSIGMSIGVGLRTSVASTLDVAAQMF
jgi:hypothetical protein